MSTRMIEAGEFYPISDVEDMLATDCLGLAESTTAAISEGSALVERLASEDRSLYGINTGFGALCRTRVPPAELSKLQRNLLLSHACGVGSPISPERTRLVLLLKLLSLRSGHSGASRLTVERLLAHLNEGLLPVIPAKGTVGASGDLAPLAHMALPLIGEGEVWRGGCPVPAGPELEARGWEPLTLAPKDGLALINGVQFITAGAVDCLRQLRRLARVADVVAAHGTQAFSCAESFYQEPLHAASFHAERQQVAANLRWLLTGSNHAQLPNCDPACEDPYSFRCVPQVHGAVRQTLAFATDVLERELNGVSDNPLVFPAQGTMLTGGHLHGQSVAFALDFLAIAASELASISERRTYQLLSAQRGLPSFLAQAPGLHSGLMVVQYTSASLVSETKVLASPASTDTIMTCQLQEDHVSMGGTGVNKLDTILTDLALVLANELLTAVQAADLSPALVLSPRTATLQAAFRVRVPFVTEDRPMYEPMRSARAFLDESEALARLVGALQ